MKTEDFKPLYNDQGQVNNPEIARKMAQNEEDLHNNPELFEIAKKYHPANLPQDDQTIIDKNSEGIGKYMHEREYEKYLEKKMEDITKKLKGILTADEVDILKEYIEDDESGNTDIKFLYKILKGELE